MEDGEGVVVLVYVFNLPASFFSDFTGGGLPESFPWFIRGYLLGKLAGGYELWSK